MKNMNDEMMRQAELDLLVDGELGEEKRDALLSSLDAEPGQWREVGIRFLERQMEKETVRGLMSGQTTIGRGEIAPTRRRVVTWWRAGAIAASVAVACGCVGIGMYVERKSGETLAGAVQYVNATGVAKVVGMPEDVKVSVPVVSVKSAGRTNLFAVEDGTMPKQGSKRSVILTPDGQGGAVMIPVNTLPMKVY